MGALILLLLVTTRRMRHVAVEKAIEARQTKVAEELAARAKAPAPPVLPDVPTKSLEPAPLYVPPAAIQLARPVPVVDEVAEAKLRSEWKSIVDELARDYSDQVKLLAAIRADTVLKQQEQEAEKTALEEEKGRIEKKKRKAYSLRQETAADVARLEQDKALLDGELKKVKRATNIKAEELANQPTPYTLLPYDGALGTTRRPIILECNERSITFRCEGIELAASQLSGFPSEYNPLLAGTRALHEYWVVRDRETATLKTPPPPYVLLVVRPKGTVAYYVARKLLEKFEHPYGYELVEEGRELTWPASDDDAVRICREAVERALTERDRVLARLADPGSGGGGDGGGNGGRYPITGDLRYDGQGGEFVTDEVEQLRNLDDSVVVGGQRWKREPRGNGGPGGGAGGGPLDPGPSTLPTPFQASRGGGRSGPGTGTPGTGNGGSANGGPAGTGPNQGEPGGASFGEAADSRLAAADPDSAGGGSRNGGGGGTGTGSGPNGPEGAGSRSRSSGDSRSPGGSRTFEGSGGPRLGGGGSGDLHPYHDLPSRPSEPDAPQGTGPITARNVPRLAHGQGRGTGSAQGGTATGAGPGAGTGTGTGPATSPPSGNIRGTGQGSGGAAAGGSSENPGSEEGTGLAGDGGTGGGANSDDATSDRTLASNGTGGSRGGAPGTGSRSRFSGQAGTGQAGSGDASSGAQGFGATDAGASGFDPGTGGQAGSGASGGGTPGPAGGGGGSGGSAGGGGASSGMPGDAAAGSAPEGMPVPRNLRAIGQQGPSGKPGTGKAAPRRWGEPDHSGTIALERAVIIDVKEDGVTVEDEPELTLKDGTAYRELKDRLAFTLENHVGKWGRPPASFYWLPNVTFRIHPGGNQYYQAMKALTDDWGLHSKVEHVLE